MRLAYVLLMILLLGGCATKQPEAQLEKTYPQIVEEKPFTLDDLDLYDTIPIQSKKGHSRWNSVLERSPERMPHGAKFDNMMDKARDAGQSFDALRYVNNFWNDYEYVDDKDSYGVSDYWATPLEMYKLGGGDCEDFAIAKYFTLRKLGFEPQNMRLLILQKAKAKSSHCVLAVNIGKTQYILESRYRGVNRLDSYHYGELKVSMNEKATWVHLVRKETAAKGA